MARNDYWRACGRKRRFSSRRAAARYTFDGMHVYRCPFSGGQPHYHVGH